MAMVLGGGPHHGRTTDVDCFDRLGPAHPRAGNGGLKRIEIHHHQVDRGDAMGGQIRLVGGLIRPGQDAAMDAGVQGFYPATE